MFEFFLGLVLLGILAGLLSGFFGIGSGVILVPAYVFLFNLLDLPPEIIPILATGTSMTTMAITIPMAAFIHFKNSGSLALLLSLEYSTRTLGEQAKS